MYCFELVARNVPFYIDSMQPECAINDNEPMQIKKS